MHLKNNSVLVSLLGGLVLVGVVFVYMDSQARGFPDGHLTELDRAEKRLANVFVYLSVPVGLWLLALSRIALRRRVVNEFRITTILYALLVLLLLLIDYYLRQHLDNGVGG